MLEVYLADYRFADSQQDFIRDDWLLLDLRSLGTIRSLRFDIESSDVGNFGINTPTYFALDNITISAVPEPRLAILAIPAVVGLVMIGRYGARPKKKH